MKLILINGCDRAGKDTLSAQIKSLLNPDSVEIFCLAMSLKSLAMTAINMLADLRGEEDL